MPEVKENHFSQGPNVTDPKNLIICTKDSLNAAMLRFETKRTIEEIEKNLKAAKDRQDNSKDPADKEQIELERKQLKDKVNQLKKALPYITPHMCSLDGNRKITNDPKNYTESYWVMMDYDGLPDPRSTWKKYLEHLVGDLHIVFAYISPSGHGLKVMFLRPENMTIKEAQAWFAKEAKMPDYDAKTFEPNRACYLAPMDYVLHYQPEILFDPAMNNIGYTRELSEHIVIVTESTDVNPTVDVGFVMPTYHGLKLEDIRDKFIEIHLNGKTPMSGSRNTDTYELAQNLRYVANFDPSVLDQLIPCYDGFSEQEKRNVINSALKADRYSMPKKMQAVLSALKAENVDNPDLIKDLDEAEEHEASYPYTCLSHCFGEQDVVTGDWEINFPQGIADSFDGIMPSLRMAMFIAIGPMIGALATQVYLNVHGEYSKLNLQAYLVGEAGSNKSKCDALFKTWMFRKIAEDKITSTMEIQYKALPQKEKDKQEKQVFFYHIQAPRTSIADVIQNLRLAQGRHIFSYASEADQATNSRKSGAFADVTVILRLGFDGSPFLSHYAGNDAANGNIDAVLWNSTMCTTPDGLYRAFREYLDGTLSRQAIASTPDNTYARLIITPQRKEKSVENIKQVASLLELMKGDLDLPLLEMRAQEWLERERLQSLKNGDRARANQRKRICVTAMRYCACLMLCGFADYLITQLDRRSPSRALPKWSDGAKTAEEFLKTHPQAVEKMVPRRFQTAPYIQSFDIIADYLLENVLYYFRDRIERAYNNPDYQTSQRQRNSANDSIYDRLGQIFTIDDLRREKSKDYTGNDLDNTVKQMAKNWKKNGLCESIDKGKYKKL